MDEYEAIMINEDGASWVVSAWGETLESAQLMAERGIQDLPGWTVTLTGDVRN